MRGISVDQIQEQEIDDDMDTSTINQATDQVAMEQRVQEQLHPQNKPLSTAEDMQDRVMQYEVPDTLTCDQGQINEEGIENPREDIESMTYIPSTPPNRTLNEGLPVDPDLLSPHLDRLRIEQTSNDQPSNISIQPSSASIPERDESINMLHEHVRINQQHANERARRQYGKQRQTTTFDVGDQVSVAVPALDGASTDDKRLFGRVIEVIQDHDSYKILTKYGVLDRNYPISELNPLPSHIEIGIPPPPPRATVTLHYCATQESTTEKVPVHCNCRDQKTWCSTRRCACVKAEAKCSIACHGGRNQDNTPDCPNISSMAMRTQQGHRTRDGGQAAKKDAKRQRRDSAGQWIASKVNDTRSSKRGGRK